MARRKRKGLFSKVIVTTVIISNILFAATVLFVFMRTAAEPSALVASWFAFTTGELWSLAFIRKSKLKDMKKEEKDG